ncbi:MAG: transposase, partial [Nitrososphaerota archaeon]
CECGFEYHKDGVGAINIFKRYRGKSHVVGVLASPVGLRSHGVSISP